jgi:alpha-beta hydrolase superfamily lysophospholipase
MKTDYRIQCFDDVQLSGYRSCNVQSPKAILVIAHGMAETIERYAPFFDFLAENGLCVYGHSHRGHGTLAASSNQLGHLSEGGWSRMREELKAAVLMAKESYPDTPVFLLGHSMGSFLARDFLIRDSALIDGVILSGTGFLSPQILAFGSGISKIESAIFKPTHHSTLLTALSFGTYNKKIDHPKTPFDWLSCDPEIVENYINDPLCGNVHTAGFYSEFFKNLDRILHHPDYKMLKKELPLLIFSGSQDPVGDYGKGVLLSEAHYASIGLNTTLKLYEGGRHEMLNAPNRQEVYQDVLKWIENQVIRINP